MYIFVFNWTMTLEHASDDKVPLGLVFSTFMACCMGGSSLFSVLSLKGVQLHFMLGGAFILSAVCMLVPVINKPPVWAVLIAFLVFEACVGLYWPAMGAAKARVVPEQARATIYNFYRVPLNVIVVAVLLAQQFPARMAFMSCACMLAGAALLLFGVKVPPGDAARDAPGGTRTPSPDKEPLVD
jgi:MFS family permease